MLQLSQRFIMASPAETPITMATPLRISPLRLASRSNAAGLHGSRCSGSIILAAFQSFIASSSECTSPSTRFHRGIYGVRPLIFKAAAAEAASIETPGISLSASRAASKTSNKRSPNSDVRCFAARSFSSGAAISYHTNASKTSDTSDRIQGMIAAQVCSLVQGHSLFRPGRGRASSSTTIKRSSTERLTGKPFIPSKCGHTAMVHTKTRSRTMPVAHSSSTKAPILTRRLRRVDSQPSVHGNL